MLNWLHIILLITSIALLFICFYLILKSRKMNAKLDKKLALRTDFLHKENDKLLNEIKRLQTLYNHVLTNNNITNPQKTGTAINSENMISEKEILELEKRKMQEKNKMIWDMTLSVNKEKERINGLKSEIEEKHRVVTDSIQYASRIQNALHPPAEKINSWIANYFIIRRPKHIVSGDFYWIKKIKEHLIFTVADCTGHGVPGAFMSMLGIAYLNEIISENRLEPHQILEKLRELVKTSLHQFEKNTDQKDGIDIAICVLNTVTNQLKYSGANNPAYILRNHEIIELKATRNPIGIHPHEKAFEIQNVQLHNNDKIYLFSDGYIDQFGGASGRKLTSAKFKKILIETDKKAESMESQKIHLENELNNWMLGYKKQIDDIMVLGIKIP